MTITTLTAATRTRLIELLIERGTVYRETPVHLATGEDTHIYLDVKGVLRDGAGLFIAAQALAEWIAALDLAPTTIGGPTMGADVLAHPLTLLRHLTDPHHPLTWFSIRDKIKTDHGMGKRIEGAELGPQDTVVITDDVANSGESLVEAVSYVQETGAQVLAVVPLVDRSDKTATKMAALGVPYYPLLTSDDLELAPLK